MEFRNHIKPYKTKKTASFEAVFVPVTDQFSNYFYKNIEEIYALKELVKNERIELNTSQSPAFGKEEVNSIFPK